MVKRESRAKRWERAVSDVQDGLARLTELQEEYQEWLDNMSDSFDGTATQEKLEAVCELDIEGCTSTLDEAEGVELPLGFGRD